MKTTTPILILLFLPFFSFSQSFFINSTNYAGTENYIYEIDLNTLTQEEIYACPTTNSDNQVFEMRYHDIAVTQSHIYYCSAWGSLYRKSITDDLSCEYLGTFNIAINSLCSDGSNYIYAAGFQNGESYIYKYNITTGVFSFMGYLPNEIIPAGDLFFYQNRFYVTTKNWDLPSCGIYEINMQDVNNSCNVMSLGNLQAYGAFSIDFGIYSKAYILVFDQGTVTGTVYELDMEQYELGEPIYQINNSYITGAAAVYERTSLNSVCGVLGLPDTEQAGNYMNIANPVTNKIEIETNIDQNDILESRLFDISGRIIRDFSNKSFDEFYVSGASSGTYILELKLSTGQKISKKIIIE
ncbi:T9SS type A sorting domain-containing protein [Flavobacterium alkalisoli]|uniref:T9SS type A sorting domain-containing protein n=1 Tax=Flavobacterium alkalisoli TaxID=2602769 RepID=UPI003A944C9A